MEEGMVVYYTTYGRIITSYIRHTVVLLYVYNLIYIYINLIQFTYLPTRTHARTHVYPPFHLLSLKEIPFVSHSASPPRLCSHPQTAYTVHGSTVHTYDT